MKKSPPEVKFRDCVNGTIPIGRYKTKELSIYFDPLSKENYVVLHYIGK